MKHDRTEMTHVDVTTIGPFRILDAIDSGGMAHVYRAEDGLGRFGVVALKVMRDEISMGTEYQIRFRREAKIWAELDHPNIVPIFDYSVEPGQAYVAMRFIDGCSLHDLLAEKGSLSVEYALPIMKDVLAAVEYAHSRQVIHRDIKPDNVMLDKAGRAYLTDFGIAKPLGATELTATGARLGTPTYMSPEQIRGRKDITAKADLYAVGVMFYEMLTGSPPFKSEDPIVLGHAHAYEPPPPMKRRGAPFPEDLQTLVMKALEKEPRRRPRSAKAMLRVLQTFERRCRRAPTEPSLVPDASDAAVVRAAASAADRRARAPRRPRRRRTSLVVAPRLSRGLAPPVGAFMRMAFLLVVGVLVVVFGLGGRLAAGAAEAVRMLRDGYHRVVGDRAAADVSSLLERGQVSMALIAFERLVEREPDRSAEVAARCRAEGLKAGAEGRLRDAELLLSYCARLDPEDMDVRFALARVFIAQNQPLEAAREYARALGGVSNAGLLEHLSRNGDLALSLPHRERRLAASRYYLAGRGLLVAGEGDLARPYFEAARTLEPGSELYRRLVETGSSARPAAGAARRGSSAGGRR